MVGGDSRGWSLIKGGIFYPGGVVGVDRSSSSDAGGSWFLTPLRLKIPLLLPSDSMEQGVSAGRTLRGRIFEFLAKMSC